MADSSRDKLRSEVDALRKQLREQEARLARGKSSRVRSEVGDAVDSEQVVRILNDFAPWLRRGSGTVFGILGLDRKGKIRQASSDLARRLGSSRSVVDRPFDEWVVDEDRLSWRRQLESLYKNHIKVVFNFRMRRAEGIRETEGALTAEDGNPDRVWLALRDAAGTPESLLAGTGDEARRWAGVYAHELNQPLAAALGYAQGALSLLKKECDAPPEATDALDRVCDRLKLAAGIVRRLRGLAAGEAPKRSRSDLRELARQGVETCQDMIDANGIRVSFDVPPSPMLVEVDPVQIVQVIVNLIRNAVEATAEVSPSRRRLAVRVGVDEGKANLVVEDEGVGIDPGKIDRLFSPWDSTKPMGLGVGLTLARQFVESNGGRISASVRSPHGSVFMVSFPLSH